MIAPCFAAKQLLAPCHVYLCFHSRFHLDPLPQQKHFANLSRIRRATPCVDGFDVDREVARAAAYGTKSNRRRIYGRAVQERGVGRVCLSAASRQLFDVNTQTAGMVRGEEEHLAAVCWNMKYTQQN
jgi:hypothetical protein